MVLVRNQPSSVTVSGTIDGIRSRAPLAGSSDWKTTIDNPVLPFRVQCPVTNPGACDTPGTTSSRNPRSAASWSLIVTLTTTACMSLSVPALPACYAETACIGSSAATAKSLLTAATSSGNADRLTLSEKPIGPSSGRKKSSKWFATTVRGSRRARMRCQ